MALVELLSLLEKGVGGDIELRDLIAKAASEYDSHRREVFASGNRPSFSSYLEGYLKGAITLGHSEVMQKVFGEKPGEEVPF
jgi:hypothetical protein